MKVLTGLFKFSSLIVLMLMSFAVSAEVASLSGTITDEQGLALTSVKVIATEIASGKKTSTVSNAKGDYRFERLIAGKYTLKLEKAGYLKFSKGNIIISNGKTQTVNVTLKIAAPEPVIIETLDEEVQEDKISEPRSQYFSMKKTESYVSNGIGGGNYNKEGQYHNTESYNAIEENGYQLTTTSPLSTFSVDVDAASYSNVRRFLLSGQKPVEGAVRIEEMINYFNYDYPEPTGDDPFSITTEISDCPWNNNKLVHIGLQGKSIEKDNLPASNLVFLLDVSGSMDQPNKLPLLKKSFKLLVQELGDRDRIAIVVYAGAAGIVLNSTPASNSPEILAALENLSAGGSTAGGAGIKLAYKVAEDNFIEGGNNRVILATDGDFNIGMSSQSAMKTLIEQKRESGVFLTCLGFGTGNFKDAEMEMLADKGNGNYAYIDNLLEAKKVLVTEIGATLVTIAKDVKIQVEFNPNLVASYRLVGYENRLLNAEDFNDDKKDAGEIGAGHSVTALYEVVMKGEEDGTTPSVDPLRYQSNEIETPTNFKNELLTVKFRYKAPDGDMSKLIVRNLKNRITALDKTSNNFKFSATVACFGMLLRDSEYKGIATYTNVLKWAKATKGNDENGYRAELIRLIEAAEMIYN